MYKDSASKVAMKTLLCSRARSSYCCSSMIFMNSKVSFGMCVLLKMRGLSASSKRMAEFSVAQFIPDTMGLKGLPGLCVLGLK